METMETMDEVTDLTGKILGQTIAKYPKSFIWIILTILFSAGSWLKYDFGEALTTGALFGFILVLGHGILDAIKASK